MDLTRILALVGAVAFTGCASGPAPIALANRTFYQYDEEVASANGPRFEQPYPALDHSDGSKPFVGVAILGGSVVLSRPASWRIRRASLTPERRFVEYVSPHGYLVAVYERIDSPADAWRDVLGRYEDEVGAKGAKILGRRIPIAVGGSQGREYVIERAVGGQRTPFVNTSREIVLRGEHRIDVLEIVESDETRALVRGELGPVLDTLSVR